MSRCGRLAQSSLTPLSSDDPSLAQGLWRALALTGRGTSEGKKTVPKASGASLPPSIFARLAFAALTARSWRTSGLTLRVTCLLLYVWLIFIVVEGPASYQPLL